MHISTIEITPIKVRENHVDFSTIEITSKKARGNHVDFWTSKITLKKVRGNNVDFSTIEITWKKVHGNHVDFSTSKITSKKVPGNHVDFSTIEITLKKYAEMTWKFVEIWSSTYRRNIHVESTWIQCGVPVGKQLLQRVTGGFLRRVTSDFTTSNEQRVNFNEQRATIEKLRLITYTLEKRVFAAATFKGLWVASFQTK